MPRSSIRRRVSRIAGSAVALAMLVPASVAGIAQSAPAQPADGPPLHFMVIGPPGSGLAQTEDSVESTGGAVVQSWPQIGVVVATSQDTAFAEQLRGQPGVQQAGASRDFAELVPPPAQTHAAKGMEPLEGTVEPPAAATAEGEPLEPEQWDMPAIKAAEAHAVSQGSNDTVVGVLDYGMDPEHPDLKPNLDVSKSVSCADEGVPNQDIEAWAPRDESQAHGSHVAGTVAAARNDVGIAGVAPNVTLASVRVVSDKGFIFPEYAVCGFMWAAEQGFEVTNSSWFVDPWYLWCEGDPDQQAIAEGVRRAVEYSQSKNVANVAAAGNSNWDLSKPIRDTNSPNHGGPTQDRHTGPDCHKLPAELPGVVTTSSTGVEDVKSYFSNYGIQSIDVTAPGGDANQIPETPSKNGRVLSTVPGGGWGWMQGTSMASPHAAGVLALIRSTHPEMTAQQAIGVLKGQSDAIPCPTHYDPDGDGKPDAVCNGGATGAGFYGAGMVDALDAVQG